MKKVVIYSRVSSQQQDNESQIDQLRQYAKSNGFEVDKVFAEKVSGYDQTKERPSYDEMKEYILTNDIKYILMWELSRLARNTLKSLQEIKSLGDQGINIYFKKENINTLSEEPSAKLKTSIRHDCELETSQFWMKSIMTVNNVFIMLNSL